MTAPKIGIILSTTRPNRFADIPGNWMMAGTLDRDDLDAEIVDLRDYQLPFFDAPMSPARSPIEGDAARRWSDKIASLDGFIFVVAEYNHSISGVLKNALDFAYFEFNRKPAAYVGYGGVGAARAIEQLRLINVEQQATPLRAAVHIGTEPFLGVVQQGKSLSDFEYLNTARTELLDDLSWWTQALRSARNGSAIARAA